MQVNKSRLLDWSRQNGVRGGVANMTHSDVAEASADLGVSYDEIRRVLDDIIANGVSANETAGQSSKSLRQAVGNASAGVRAADARTSPALMGHNLQVPSDAGGMRGSQIALAKAELADTLPQDLNDWVQLHFGNVDTMPSAKAKVAADLLRDYVSDFDPPTSAFERAAFDTLDALDAQAGANVVENENGKFDFDIMAEMRALAKAGKYSGSAEAINGVLAKWGEGGGLKMLDVNLTTADFDYLMTVVNEEVGGAPKSGRPPKGIDAANLVKDLRDLSRTEFYSTDSGRLMGHDLKLLADALQARLF